MAFSARRKLRDECNEDHNEGEGQYGEGDDGKGEDGDLADTVPRGKVKVVRDKQGSEREKILLKLRACLSCRLVMSEQQFYEEGCPNCPALQVDGDKHRVWDCSTANFSGLISLTVPEKSWVARYNDLTDVVPGCYAVEVVGELPESVRDDIHRQKNEDHR